MGFDHPRRGVQVYARVDLSGGQFERPFGHRVIAEVVEVLGDGIEDRLERLPGRLVRLKIIRLVFEKDIGFAIRPSCESPKLIRVVLRRQGGRVRAFDGFLLRLFHRFADRVQVVNDGGVELLKRQFLRGLRGPHAHLGPDQIMRVVQRARLRRLWRRRCFGRFDRGRCGQSCLVRFRRLDILGEYVLLNRHVPCEVLREMVRSHAGPRVNLAEPRHAGIGRFRTVHPGFDKAQRQRRVYKVLGGWHFAFKGFAHRDHRGDFGPDDRGGFRRRRDNRRHAGGFPGEPGGGAGDPALRRIHHGTREAGPEVSKILRFPVRVLVHQNLPEPGRQSHRPAHCRDRPAGAAEQRARAHHGEIRGEGGDIGHRAIHPVGIGGHHFRGAVPTPGEPDHGELQARLDRIGKGLDRRRLGRGADRRLEIVVKHFGDGLDGKRRRAEVRIGLSLAEPGFEQHLLLVGLPVGHLRRGEPSVEKRLRFLHSGRRHLPILLR